MKTAGLVKLHMWDKLLIGFTMIILFAVFIAGCGSAEESNENQGHSHGVAATESEQLETTASLADMPAFLDNHTPLTTELYSEVGQYMDILEMIHCYCGCMDDDPAHDSLLRCYLADVEPGKVTWSDHSTSCGICKMEAEDVIAMAKQGKSTDEIIEAIDAKYKPNNM
ncbi:PCYCGC motif-containing (lipo)protein [Paenibacillus abyssi]|uniref:Lipoprotein n=1 Tax=Paenibacillus abyssi TaxID=1340531 RepID=A0A917FZJ5_9BACL|nr:PCYCGC motif-containing (lipo)protein [Paenibacillus abyssi]GGG15289.1 hypothetical protein GCM10010916_35270 [Paenibacillus abyssi]